MVGSFIEMTDTSLGRQYQGGDQDLDLAMLEVKIIVRHLIWRWQVYTELSR